jgi:hypothetical protein
MLSRNCAPVNITGGTGDQAQIDSLPEIFVANYPNDPTVPNCITGAGSDKIILNFPNPGLFGRVLQSPVEPATKPAGYCTQIPPASEVPTFLPDTMPPPPTSLMSSIPASTTTAMSDMPVVDSVLPPATTQITRITTPNPTTPATTMSEDDPIVDSILPPSPITDDPPPVTSPEVDSIMEPTTSTIVEVVTTTVTTTTVTTVTAGLAAPIGPGPVVAATPTSHPPSFVADRPGDKAVACQVHGELLCFEDGKMWGICNWGWVVPQDVAAGTVCYWGRIVDATEGGGV